mmetsp:Transcript_32943/g.104889  ORF Transcript_32943/g.104889 Transcript_32943/m.104889 type:complete len:647 (-) Transcript_32943:50-1990(-)
MRGGWPRARGNLDTPIARPRGVRAANFRSSSHLWRSCRPRLFPPPARCPPPSSSCRPRPVPATCSGALLFSWPPPLVYKSTLLRPDLGDGNLMRGERLFTFSPPVTMGTSSRRRSSAVPPRAAALLGFVCIALLASSAPPVSAQRLTPQVLGLLRQVPRQCLRLLEPFGTNCEPLEGASEDLPIPGQTVLPVKDAGRCCRSVNSINNARCFCNPAVIELILNAVTQETGVSQGEAADGFEVLITNIAQPQPFGCGVSISSLPANNPRGAQCFARQPPQPVTSGGGRRMMLQATESTPVEEPVEEDLEEVEEVELGESDIAALIRLLNITLPTIMDEVANDTPADAAPAEAPEPEAVAETPTDDAPAQDPEPEAASEESTDAPVTDITAYDSISAVADFSTYLEAVDSSPAAKAALKGEKGNVTLFLPSNTAIELSASVLQDDPLDPLDSIVLGGFPVESLTDGQVLTSLSKSNITVSISSGRFVVNEESTASAAVVAPDIVTANGVIHVVDRVVLPIGESPADNATATTASNEAVAVEDAPAQPLDCSYPYAYSSNSPCMRQAMTNIMRIVTSMVNNYNQAVQQAVQQQKANFAANSVPSGAYNNNAQQGSTFSANSVPSGAYNNNAQQGSTFSANSVPSGGGYKR